MTISVQEKARIMSERMKKKWKEDPEYRERMKKIRNESGVGAIWDDPERAKELLRKIREGKQDPEYREHMRKIMKEVGNQPELVAHKSEIMRKMYNTPERREQFRQQYEGHRESHTERMKELWNDPEYVYKVMKSRFNREQALKSLEKRFGWEVRQEFEHRDEK